MMSSNDSLTDNLQLLQKKLGKKQSFEEAVSSIQTLVRERYSSASPANRNLIYSSVCRVGTLLQTRYTSPGFWLAGLKLFEAAESMFSENSQKEHMKKCISRAHEHLHDLEIETPAPRQSDSRYLFEGHLTVQPEPAPPAWLVAQNLLTTLSYAQDLASVFESSENQRGSDNNSAENNRVVVNLPESLRELISNMQESGDFLDLDNAIEASLQEIGAGPQRPPPASKEIVANLPVVNVTEEALARLGSETECAVCRENLVIDDKMQELPCKHLFHPPCLKPWLEEHNSCPICRHELRTDDHAYESWKEREKEAEEERKGAANAVREGEFMYI